MSEGTADPLRRLAQERGRLLGELGVRVEDGRWVRAEADAVASLTVPRLAARLPEPLARMLRKLSRALR